MRIFTYGAIAATLFAALLNAAPASAQSRTWISGTGDDTDPCSRTAPCKTISGAYSKTASGGTITCLDSGGWGTAVISKSITIDCTGTTGGVLVTGGTTGLTINGDGINVIIRGLAMSGSSGLSTGINFLNAASLHVEDSAFMGFGRGLVFAPPTGISAKLTITNSTFSNNGDGINIAPTSTGVAKVTLDRVSVDNNGTNGLETFTGTGGRVHIAIKDGSFSGNGANGIVVNSGGGPIQVVMDGTVVAGNVSLGVHAQGANALVFMCCSTFTGNDTGWSVTSGAGLFTYGNNNNNANVTSNGVASLVPQQ
jgi:hypothetical protein